MTWKSLYKTLFPPLPRMSGFPSTCAAAPASSSSGTSRSPSATTPRWSALSSPPSWRTICRQLRRASLEWESGRRARPRDGVHCRVRDLPARHALPGGVPRSLRQVRGVRDGPCRPPRRGARRYVGHAGRRTARRRRAPGLRPRPHLRLGHGSKRGDCNL